MVEKIKETKDQVLSRMEQAIAERGVERADVTELGKLADIVKDLAEAEEACWEAEYYRSVSEAMDGDVSGYGMGYQQGAMTGRDGYRRGYQNRDSMGRYTSRRGYGERYGHQDVAQDVRSFMETASPEERERLKVQLRKMVDM